MLLYGKVLAALFIIHNKLCKMRSLILFGWLVGKKYYIIKKVSTYITRESTTL